MLENLTDYEKDLMRKNIELKSIIAKQHKRIDIFFFGVMAGLTIQFLFMTYT